MDEESKEWLAWGGLLEGCGRMTSYMLLGPTAHVVRGTPIDTIDTIDTISLRGGSDGSR